MKKILIISESPFHLVNANEFIQTLPLEEYQVDLVHIFVNTSERASVLSEKAIETLGLKIANTHIFSHNKVNGFWNILNKYKMYRELKKLYIQLSENTYDYIISGMFTSIFHTPLTHVSSDAEVVFVDDGSGTLVRYPQIDTSNSCLLLPKHKKILKKLGLPYNARKTRDKINLFTLYADDLKPYAHKYSIQKNTFNHIQSRLQKVAINDDLMVCIGTSLYTSKYLSIEDYQKLLKRMAADFQGKHILYYPHRHESKSIKNFIASLGWTMVFPETSFELELLNFKTLPSSFLMLYSTVYDTVSIMYKNAFFYAYQPAISDEKHGGLVGDYFTHLRTKKNVKIIK